MHLKRRATIRSISVKVAKKKYDMKMSVAKTKAVCTFGENTQCVKIETEGTIIDPVSDFN